MVIRSWLRWAEEEGVDPARLVGFHGVPARGIAEKLLPADRVAADNPDLVEVMRGHAAELAPLIA